MKLKNPFASYLSFLLHEFLQPMNYLIAAGIGLLILSLQGNSPFSSLVPYLVPVFVQAFSRSYLKFSRRYTEMLLSLPGRRSDPAFLMEPDGSIFLAAGKTDNEFRDHGIKRLGDLLDSRGEARVMHCVKNLQGECEAVECYSPLFDKWYRVKTAQHEDTRTVIVWFEDITLRRELDGKLSKIRDFSDSIINNLSDLLEEDDSFTRLAPLILDLGYEGVFIARTAGTALEGRVYKKKSGGESDSRDGLEISELLRVTEDSDAPVWLSHRQGRMFFDEAGAGGSTGKIISEEEFCKTYHFNEGVTHFLESDVRNFINYHEGDISIIAFNLDRRIGSGDLLAMEVLVNSARSVSSLLSLVTENEKKFLQSVTGLCAAAEYSDEITGKHILRVNEYSRFLAEMAGMSAKGQKHIGQVAAMHDIGKVAIPHLIKLNRRFTPEERREMEMHTIYGALIIEKMMSCCAATEPRLAMAYEIALNHHQMWNGAGYPGIIDDENRRVPISSRHRDSYDGLRPLKEHEIPLTARIVSLADTYDAIRSARQYKPEKSHEETMEIIRVDDRSGTRGEDRFGPDLMDLFLKHHLRFAEIYRGMQ